MSGSSALAHISGGFTLRPGEPAPRQLGVVPLPPPRCRPVALARAVPHVFLGKRRLERVQAHLREGAVLRRASIGLTSASIGLTSASIGLTSASIGLASSSIGLTSASIGLTSASFGFRAGRSVSGAERPALRYVLTDARLVFAREEESV